MATHKHYSTKFKRDAVCLTTNGPYTPTAVARTIGIQADLIKKWVKDFSSEDLGERFIGNFYHLSQEQVRDHFIKL